MKALKALLFTLILPIAAQAQITYSLPATTVNIEVSAVKECYFAGPYAKYAKKYLGIDVTQEDFCETTITEIKVSHALVADMSETYTLPSWSSDSKFLALSTQGLVAFENKEEAAQNKWLLPISDPDGGEVLYKASVLDDSIGQIPIPWDVAPDKPTEYLAKDAAEIILSARKERYNITIGNTDATFSGEALGAALAELTRLENEYLPLFTGYKTVETQHETYCIYPLKSQREHHYPVFAISETEGIVDKAGDGDIVFYLDLSSILNSSPGIVPLPAGSSTKNLIHYRVPVICDVKLTDGKKVYFSTRYPIYQLGSELTCPAR